MSAPSPASAAPASPARPPVLAPGIPASPSPARARVATPTSGNIEVVNPPSAGAAAAAPPVRQPQQDYWDEKICLEVEYNAEYPQNTIVNDGSSGYDTKTPGPSGYPAAPAPAPGGLKRSNTNASSISEPAPAYKSGDAFANSPASERGMWRGDAGVTESDRPKPAGAVLFGYPKKKVIMIAGGAVLLIGVIIAIALGVTLGVNKGSGAAPGEVQVLENTKISAMNWTEPGNGVGHQAVFYQHKDNSIMMSTRDSLSNKWRLVNVTDMAIKMTKVPALDVLSGTPIAACSNGYQHSLYYLNSRRQIQELFTTEPNADGWTGGIMGARIQTKVAPGSRLAAVRQTCLNCQGSIFVAWQEEDGSVRLANFTAGNWEQMPRITDNAGPSTGLAISTFTDFRGSGPFGTDTNAARLYLSGGTTLLEYMNGPENNFAWTQGNFGNAVTTGLTMNPSPDIASITYGSAGWFNNLVSYIDAKGGIMSSVWRGQSWSVQQAALSGAPAGADTFTSIATTQEMRLYAKAKNGKIHEFQTTASNPFSWAYQGALW